MNSGASAACRAPGCKGACADHRYYCDLDFAMLLSGLLDTIEIVYDRARELYIGRTHYPEQRLLGHRCERELDHLAVLHWAGDRDEIRDLEERLIREMKGPTTSGHDRLKVANESETSDGGWAGHWNCVYVAWQWKDSAGRWPGFVEVKSLDRGHRLCPDRAALVKRPDYLFTQLRPSEAKRELELLDPRMV